MSQVPAKIVLKSTTKMSLNDRFTNIQKVRPQTAAPTIRANMMAQQQASAKNRRLAQQLANRPGVGAINPQQIGGGMPPGAGVAAAMRLKKRSLQQRLGRSNVKARLNLAAVGRGPSRGGPRGNRRGGRGQRRGRGGQIGGQMSRQQSYGSAGGDMGVGFSPNQEFRPQRRGGRGMRRGGFRGGQGARGYQGGFNRGRGGRGGNSPGGRGRFQRGGRRFQGRGRGRGQGRGGRGGRGGPQSQMSREELDNQLEEYMSKTKSHLDSELDAYMADAS